MYIYNDMDRMVIDSIKINYHDLHSATNKIFSGNFESITGPWSQPIYIHEAFFALIKLGVWLNMV